jgi:hypothetical protein
MRIDRRDLIAACARLGFSHLRLEGELRRAKIERELEQTSAAMFAATRRLDAAIGSPEFGELSEECDRLFARHERLMDLAYPESTKKALAARAAERETKP